jgi:hypothetical protein
MQSQWPGQPQYMVSDQQPTGQRQALSPLVELAGRADTLLRRLQDVEEVLTDQEWWLMGNAFPEAQRLAEVTSLLSVARGEIETFLVESCGVVINPPEERQATDDDVYALMGDPMWMSGSREKATALLRMLTAQTPPMRQYAHALQVNAERLHLPSTAIDPLGISAERLAEIEEILRQPLY